MIEFWARPSSIELAPHRGLRRLVHRDRRAVLGECAGTTDHRRDRGRGHGLYEFGVRIWRFHGAILRPSVQEVHRDRI